MKLTKNFPLLPLFCFLCLVTYQSIAAPGNENLKTSRYILGIGDTIEVAVWRQDELSRKVIIRPDGMISLPLVGDIRADGLAPEKLSKNIALCLSKFIKAPKVSIIVTDFESKRVLVLGEVMNPGIYKLSKQLTALEAISQAGGYTRYALLTNIVVTREAYSNKPKIFTADLWSVIHQGKFNNNVVLKPGDIVYVPNSVVGKISDFMEFFNSNIKPAADTFWLYSEAE